MTDEIGRGRPAQETVEQVGDNTLRQDAVDIAVDGGSISGTVLCPGTLVPGVLFVHGWGGSQSLYVARAREIAALGCICLTFDLRGHACTRIQFETVTRAQNLQDLLAAYDLLVGRYPVDPTAVAVVGSSYGGYLATILTGLRPVKWLVLRAPALYIDDGWDSPKLQLHKDQDLRSYRARLVLASENRALQACERFSGDMLLVESEHDTIVPRTVLTSYREAARQARSLSYRCLDGADHGLSNEAGQQAYAAVLKAWFKEMLAGARSGTMMPSPSAPALVPETAPDRPQ